ncbi:MAG TPA: hypothetical protein VNO83_11815 [Pseudonocardia sp.]|nr:hypothetical protein [Pseudonocardia sp.]
MWHNTAPDLVQRGEELAHPPVGTPQRRGVEGDLGQRPAGHQGQHGDRLLGVHAHDPGRRPDAVLGQQRVDVHLLGLLPAPLVGVPLDDQRVGAGQPDLVHGAQLPA